MGYGSGGAGNSGPAVWFRDGSLRLPMGGVLPILPGSMRSNASRPAVIRVQLFASYAERLETSVIELPAEGVRTAGDVLDRLRSLPGGSALGPSTLVAVNLRHAPRETPVHSGDEVAIMPPLAGG
jgi:molybdopterin converting factor small subunit